ncbi:MAG: glycosyltransferase family 4 protein [Candidatus Latescibacterota bacterium]|nr:MAG: glycosyltransferase family 4 protein [Candidatus Latescibacterota bacterium]
MVLPDKAAVGSGETALVGTYLPRCCGIATFTYDLAETLARVHPSRSGVIVAAMNDRPEGYAYPERVKLQIRCDVVDDFLQAAEYLNRHSRVVSLQHEYGIFGGGCGENVLHLIRRLRVPLVVTCHTVYPEPDPDKKAVFDEIVSRADRLIVMNQYAMPYLESLHGARRSQIVYIRHGIHDVPFVDPPVKKRVFGVNGPVLLTFGLLHRNKGLEQAVEAMATIVRARPDATYVVAGETHPVIKREEGEAYRSELKHQVKTLGLESHVKFIDRFAELSDLMAYLEETDIFVAPYLTLDHMTSGPLSYAVGAGKPVVATPFLHARELLANGRGRFVPVGDPLALAEVVLDLLENQPARDAMRRRAYAHTRSMVWPAIAREYARIFDDVTREVEPLRVGEKVVSSVAAQPTVAVRSTAHRDAIPPS